LYECSHYPNIILFFAPIRYSKLTPQSSNTPTLRQRVLKSGSWVLAGYGVSQLLRFGGNLILTRLLFPEAFGLMGIFYSIMFGVHMLTDVGISTSIIQKEHGNDQKFLNTAWTVQIIRGFVVWVVLCALAFPVANLYAQPVLAAMLPVVGLCAVIAGFNSTKLDSALRNLDAKRVTLINIGVSALGLIIMVILAWLMHSVWALVLGNVIGACLSLIASHYLLHGTNNKFAWDLDAVKHLQGMGRWIMLSSALTFLSSEGARLMIGAMLDMHQVALYTLAITMSLMLSKAMDEVAEKVYLPTYSEIYRNTPKNLKKILYKARLTIILPSWGMAVLFVFLGSQIMGVLYDVRYRGSGPMLEFLGAGSLVGCLWMSYSNALLSMGKAATNTLVTAILVVLQISAILIGFHFGGITGLIIGVAAVNWIMYPVYAYVMYRIGLWHSKLDMILVAASVLIMVLAWPHLDKIA
jgi:O-antigen/teichoic acid export membrane protein